VNIIAGEQFNLESDVQNKLKIAMNTYAGTLAGVFDRRFTGQSPAA
jgi:hypothetical protein